MEKQYPQTYLHVQHCQSGEEYVHPIRGNASLDLETRIRHFLKKEFGGEIALDGAIQPRLEGEYYAQIKTDGEPPESVRCWDSGGFYTKPTY